jgi:plastocyanin
MRITGNLLLILTFVLLAPAGRALAQPAEPVNVSLTNYAFTPDTLALKAGAPYRLHFTNTESKDHNFSAPQFFAASQVAPEDQAKIKSGAIEVGGGQMVDVTVTTPGQAGSYNFTCTHFMHRSMGMHGTITVQ